MVAAGHTNYDYHTNNLSGTQHTNSVGHNSHGSHGSHGHHGSCDTVCRS